MCEKAIDPLSQEAKDLCAQVGTEKKDFILTLDVNRNKLSTESIDGILNVVGLSRNYRNALLPESSYYGSISEDTDVEEFLNKIMSKIDMVVKDKSIEISLCGGFVKNMYLKKRGE